MAMGGAHVAVAEGPVACYYNPGALGQTIGSPSGFQMTGTGHYELSGNVLEAGNNLNSIASQCRTGGAGTGICTTANIQRNLALLNTRGAGGQGDVTGALHFKFGRFGMFFSQYGFAGFTPSPDFTNATQATFLANQSKLIVRGGSFYEFGAGYGHEIMETGLFLGANIKGIVGRTGYSEFSLTNENPETANVFRNWDRSLKTSFQPGVDVGLLWDVRESFPDVWWRPRLGFVGRNINNPRFEQPTRAREVGEKYRYSSLQGQARTGIAISPLRFWNIAADLDLTENLTYVEDYTSRFYSVGTEFNIINEPWLNIPLRGGVSKNLAQGNSGTTWHMGLGVHFMHFFFDFGAQLGERFHQVQSLGSNERLLHSAGLSAQIAILFGGSESIVEPSRDPYLPAAARPLPYRAPPPPPLRDPFRR